MPRTTVVGVGAPSVDATVRVGAPGDTVDLRLFGGFIEHFGRILYDGLWDVDAQRARPQVLAALRALRPTVLRYPGGCFADSYHWRDGVGPVDERPHHESTFWTRFVRTLGLKEDWAARFGPPEPNAFGTEEMLALAGDVGSEPCFTANVGTGTAEEAAAWVAHCDGRVRTWFLGNELWGGHEDGNAPPDEIARRSAEMAVAMRAASPVPLTLVACGYAGDTPHHGPRWNRRLLDAWAAEVDRLGPAARPDALSVHHYFPGPMIPGRPWKDTEGDYAQAVAGSARLAAELADVEAEVEGAAWDLPFFLDEWNTWCGWEELIEVEHGVAQGIYVATAFNRLLERAGRVRLAMLSQMVNCMAPIQTRGDDVFVTPVYLAALLYRDHAAGRVCDVTTEADRMIPVPPFEVDAAEATASSGWVMTEETAKAASLATSGGAGVPAVSVIDASATRAADGSTSVFLVNRAGDRPLRVHVALSDPGARRDGVLRWIHAADPFARNTADDPWAVRLATATASADEVTLAPHTAAVLVLPGS